MYINKPRKRNLNRMLSLFLAAIMCFGMLPMSSLADVSTGGSVGQFVSAVSGGGSGSGLIANYFFARYSIVRIGVSDVADSENEADTLPRWEALQAAVKNSADNLPVTNKTVVPGARINFVAAFDTYFEYPPEGTLGGTFDYHHDDSMGQFRARRYMTNALCYAALAAAGKDADAYLEYMDANEVGSVDGGYYSSKYTVTDDPTVYCPDFLDNGHNGVPEMPDPMLSFFQDGSTYAFAPTGANGVSVMYGDGEPSARVKAVFSNFGSVMEPALKAQVTDDFLTLVNNGYLPDYDHLRGATRDQVNSEVPFADQLLYAFGGCQAPGEEFCYRFVLEPGLMGCKHPALGSGYDLTLRDVMAFTLSTDYSWTGVMGLFGKIAACVMPADKELYVAYKGDGDGITYPQHEVASAGTESGSVLYYDYGTLPSTGSAVFGTAKTAMTSAANRMKQFGVGIWAGFQFPRESPPPPPPPDPEEPVSVHFLIDYNLNQHVATTASNAGAYIEIDGEHNPIDCGTVQVGQNVNIKLSDDILTPITIEKTININESGTNGSQATGSVKATYKYTYKGLFEDPEGTRPVKDSSGNAVGASRTEFTWKVPARWGAGNNHVVADQLIVMYAVWDEELVVDPDLTVTGDEEIIIPGTADDELYWVYFDYNYDGGGVVSSMFGEFMTGWKNIKLDLNVTVSCSATAHAGASITKHPLNFNMDHKVKVFFLVPENPVRRGYRFIGWTDSPYMPDTICYHGTAAEVLTAARKGNTFFALWMANDIIWDANGGKFADGAGTKTQAGGYIWRDRDDILIHPCDEEPVRTGYNFTGWYLDKECSIAAGQFEEGVDPGRTYYAGWEAERVVVTYYDSRQGTGVVETQVFKYDDMFVLLRDMNSTDGWTFSGWKINGAAAAADIS